MIRSALSAKGLGLVWACLIFAPLSWAGPVTGLPDFTGLVKEVSPAVVNISSSRKPREKARRFRSPHGQVPDDVPLDDFLRRFFGERGDGFGFDKESLGSGFIISSDGYVLSNHHVVKDADKIVVRLSDRREFDAKLVGKDKRSDIALLKIEAKDLPAVKLGSSDKLQPGEWVIAIGSPFGFDHSVTAGVVSAIGRNLPSESYVPFIQTDVAINPGNSGGPLFNMEGEVVGINSQIFSRTGGYMGLSFAIPMDLAMNVVDQLKEKGRVSRGWLGVYIQDVTGELAESFGMDKPEGALVSRVLPNSPAAAAKLQVGDVILAFGGHAITSSSDLPPLVGATAIGKAVPVKVLRDGKSLQVEVTIGELPEEISSGTGGPGGKDDSSRERRLGIQIEELTDKQRKTLGLEEKGGVLVKDVDEGPAREAGVQAGDVILMVNGTNVQNIAQFRKLVKELPADVSVPVLVHRGRSPLFLALKLPAK